MAMELTKKRRKRGVLTTLLAILLLIGGGYALVTALSPLASPLINQEDNQTVKKLAEEKVTENRLYIPKIDINLPYSTGDESVMETGAWWRKAESGNPKDGGNFVLSAHRFVMGWHPGETVKRSPFYNINKLVVGDVLAVDYDGKRYQYTVKEKYDVAPTAIEIEAPTDDNRLTLYSCGLGGANDRREVIIAQLVN